jgi:DNA repair exonuclease SbcCD nuclease subunit
MVRFLHTADWQLGMTRRFLTPEAQSRFTDARIQAIRTIGRTAQERGASFVVVAGDVFESNLVERQLVLRALEALREAATSFYLLPGNHDPLDAGSVYRSSVFANHRPENVVVLEGEPLEVEPEVWLVPAPWRSKKLTTDPLALACEGAASLPGIKIVVGHGGSEDFTPEKERADLIRTAAAEAALASGAVQYIALGDRHSRTAVGSSGRIWYSGAPEPTEYRETEPGLVLDVTLDAGELDIVPVNVATWRFTESTQVAIESAADISRLRTWLDGLPAKERTVLNLGFTGTVSLAVAAELEETIDHYRPMFGAIERRAGDSDLVVIPSESDFSSLGLSGFAARAAQDLGALALEQGPRAREARDALGLLHRLARPLA